MARTDKLVGARILVLDAVRHAANLASEYKLTTGEMVFWSAIEDLIEGRYSSANSNDAALPLREVARIYQVDIPGVQVRGL